MPGSKATERLFREALAKSPHRKTRGLVCYSLSRYLDYQASFVRLEKLIDPSQRDDFGAPLQRESWGQDYQDRLRKMSAEALEREAAALYERVVKEFADLPLENPGSDRGLPGRPTNLGGAAQIYLDELKHLGVGRPAPEIDGVDLDGKPMKLSDFCGKVVAIFFRPIQVGAEASNRPAPLAESMRRLVERHANDPFVLVGVATADPMRGNAIPESDRTAIKRAYAAAALPGRFWFDPPRNGKPGQIQTAWNASSGLYVLDHRGVIRYKHVLRPELFEKAVTTLLNQQKDELGRSKKTD
jgi:hypothetical protein